MIKIRRWNVKKANLFFCLFYPLKWFVGLNDKNNMLKAHYLIKTISRLFKMGFRCIWNNIFQINTLPQEQKCHSLIFLYTRTKNVLVFFKTVPQRRSHPELPSRCTIILTDTPLLYLLKTSQKLRFPGAFRGYRNETLP